MLKKFFRSRVRPAEALPTDPERRSYGSSPIISRDLPVEILAENGSTLLTGRLSSFSLARITVERILDTFTLPALPVGKEVTVRGYDKDLEPIHFTAQVKESTVLHCQLENLRLVPVDPNRSAVRLPLFDTKAELYAIGDLQMNFPIECEVKNISTTGACITSEYCYEPNSTLRLRVELVKGGGPISLHCQIVRTTMLEDGTFEYGLIFAQLNQHKYHELVVDIKMAREAIQKKLNS